MGTPWPVGVIGTHRRRANKRRRCSVCAAAAPTLAPTTSKPTLAPTAPPTTLAPTTMEPTTLAPTTMMPTGAALCRTAANCNIFGGDCTGGAACYLAGDDGTTDCAMAGTGTTGATCMYTNDCAAGFSCLGGASGSTCRKLCDSVDMDPGCAAGETCSTLSLPAPLTNVGACAS